MRRSLHLVCMVFVLGNLSTAQMIHVPWDHSNIQTTRYFLIPDSKQNLKLEVNHFNVLRYQLIKNGSPIVLEIGINSLRERKDNYGYESQDTVWSRPNLTTQRQRTRPYKYKSWISRSVIILSSSAVLIVFLTIGIIRYRTAQLKKAKLHLELEVSRRIEEINEKNAQILEMERLKTHFFTDVSHEIRTPLTLISGPLEQLINQDYRDPRIIRWLSLIRRNTQHLVQLVNQLLDISRLDAGFMKLILEESDLYRHIKRLAQEYLFLSESKDIEYMIDIPDGSLSACYDKEKLEKIITNLLSNAFKFTAAGGIVTCRLKVYNGAATDSDPKIRLIVADTGRGIPFSLKDKIFERFFRGEEVANPLTDGTGIGLTLTKEMVKIMHGEILMRSRVGEGSVFMVTIPTGYSHLEADEYLMKDLSDLQYADSLLSEEKKPGLEKSQLENSNLSILVVEDNRDLLAFLLENLSTEFSVRGAYNGEQALSIATSELPDLIITDVMMPGEIDGIELCKKLKNYEQTSHIPVIILTAKSTSTDKITGLEEGADDYLIKPFNLDELLVRMRNLLKQREKLRKKYSSMIGMDWEKIPVTTLDEKFLKKVLDIISENMTDFNFNVSALQEKMFMSREHIFRKLKALTGKSPSDMIRIMRLKAAAYMLGNGKANIARVAMQVGFSNPSYFSQCFKAHFGQSPSKYAFRKQADYSP